MCYDLHCGGTVGQAVDRDRSVAVGGEAGGATGSERTWVDGWDTVQSLGTDIPIRTDREPAPPLNESKVVLYGTQGGNCNGCAELISCRSI